MSRPRVFYVLGSLSATDTGEEVVGMLGRLAESPFEPRVVSLGGTDQLRSAIVQTGVKVHALGLAGPWGTWRAVARVRALARQHGADLLHGFGSWGGAVAQLAAPRDVPVVRSVGRVPNPLPDLVGRVLRVMERRARSKVHTHFVVPNEEARQLAVKVYGAVEGHVLVVPTAVDVQAVRAAMAENPPDSARRHMGMGPEEAAVALLTEFDSEADMDRILTGFSIATRERPGLRLFVIGAGRHEGSIRWKAEELQLGDSVVFLGRVRATDPVWGAVDLVVDATPVNPWTRSALVAMAAGLPTLKWTDGRPARTEAGGEGWPSVSAHPERFAGEIVRLLHDGALREEVVGRGRHVEAEVDVGPIVERLGVLYDSLLGR